MGIKVITGEEAPRGPPALQTQAGETSQTPTINMTLYAERRQGGNDVNMSTTGKGWGTFGIPGIPYKFESNGGTQCSRCGNAFNFLRKWHHCWAGCGKLVCDTCAPKPKSGLKNERICSTCKPEWEAWIADKEV